MPELADLNLERLGETCRLRATLEEFAAGSLHRHPDRESLLNRFTEPLSELKAAALQGDRIAFYHADYAFHGLMVESANLPILTSVWREVWKELGQFVPKITKHYQPSLLDTYREHEFLLVAWFSEDATVARQATFHHIDLGWQRVAMSLQSPQPGGLTAHPVDRATYFLQMHFANDVDVNWLAKHVSFVSPSHLTRSFRERLGVTPYAYLRQLRMSKAADLLQRTVESVLDIGRSVGYKNASHFVKDFRQAYGVTPKQFRTQQVHSRVGAAETLLEGGEGLDKS